MVGSSHPQLSFTDAVMVNLNRLDHATLATRVDRLLVAGQSRIPRDHLQLIRGDSNTILESIMSGFHPKDYLWVFADLEAPRSWS
jgi:hypothetical protein